MADRIWDKYLSEEDKAVFEASGFGALADWGERPALAIVDVNYAFCDDKRPWCTLLPRSVVLGYEHVSNN